MHACVVCMEGERASVQNDAAYLSVPNACVVVRTYI